MRRVALLLVLIACRSNEDESVKKLEAKHTDLDRRVGVIEQRGPVDTQAIASELLAKGSAAGLHGPAGPEGPAGPAGPVGPMGPAGGGPPGPGGAPRSCPSRWPGRPDGSRGRRPTRSDRRARRERRSRSGWS